MVHRCDVVVYKRMLKLDVVFPTLDQAISFMSVFLKTFVEPDPHGEVVNLCQPPECRYQVSAVIRVEDEDRFYSLLLDFCINKDLFFRDPRKQPVS